MKISTIKSETYIKELSESKVEVKFTKEYHNGYPEYDSLSNKLRIVPVKSKETELGVIEYIYYPFNLTLNNSFHHSPSSVLFGNSEYSKHVDDITQTFVDEIDTNIRMRLGKWDILDYFSLLKLKLRKLSTGFEESPNKSSLNDRKIYTNKHQKLSHNDFDAITGTNSYYWIEYVLTTYWTTQMKSLDRIIEYIEIREQIIERTEDYVRAIEELPMAAGSLVWNKTDTDLLELITSLIESGSIQNRTKDLTRKEAIEIFSNIFNLEIKDAESKLSRATSRKKDVAHFLTTLKETFEDYSQEKDDNLDALRR